jgi:hypothetical protein
MSRVTDLLDNERRGMVLHLQQLRERRAKVAEQLAEIDTQVATSEKELSDFDEDMSALPQRMKPTEGGEVIKR